ncbi:MAG: ACT domain-containing protein, partial [Anaerovoracaceae bacterium]
SLEDKAGGLHHVLALLADAGIAVNYIYSTIKSAEGKAIIMMKVADSDKAVEVLKSSGVELVGVESL